MPPKFLENIVILCFEKRFSKQNSVIHLKSNYVAPQKIFGPPKFMGWLRHWQQCIHYVCSFLWPCRQKHIYTVLTVTTGPVRANIMLIWPSVKISLTTCYSAAE